MKEAIDGLLALTDETLEPKLKSMQRTFRSERWKFNPAVVDELMTISNDSKRSDQVRKHALYLLADAFINDRTLADPKQEEALRDISSTETTSKSKKLVVEAASFAYDRWRLAHDPVTYHTERAVEFGAPTRS